MKREKKRISIASHSISSVIVYLRHFKKRTEESYVLRKMIYTINKERIIIKQCF